MMSERYVLNGDALPEIRNTALFYPCSGNDLDVSIQLFSPFVSDFWFVDRGYFSSGHQDTRNYGFDAPADKQKPLLEADSNYRLIGKPTIVGPPNWDRDDRDIEPCILTETYLHIASERCFRIHRRRGYGFSALDKVITSLGVFFYRGDSEGEGGSGNLWLASDHLSDVLDKLVDGGLIVTDGSQHGTTYRNNYAKEYEELWKWRFQSCSMKAEEIIESAKAFTDKAGRTFTCVGYAGHRYGPTLIWQVKKAAYTDERTSARCVTAHPRRLRILSPGKRWSR